KTPNRSTFQDPTRIRDEYPRFLSVRSRVLREGKDLPDIPQPQSLTYGKVFQFVLALGHGRCNKKQIAIKERANFITRQNATAISVSMVANQQASGNLLCQAGRRLGQHEQKRVWRSR